MAMQSKNQKSQVTTRQML